MQLHQLAEHFWHLIEDRYPGSAIWWHREGSGGQWPEWSEAAFQREMRSWLSLAAEAGLLAELVEADSWGRYARLAAGRLRGEVWRRSDAPLSHARHNLEVLWMIGDYVAFFKALKSLPDWLKSIAGMVAGDFWTTIELSREAHGLLRGACVMPVPPGMDALRWAVAEDQAKLAIHAYVETAKNHSYGTVTVVPWIASAHVDVMSWRQRRNQFDVPPGEHFRMASGGRELANGLRFHSRCQTQSSGWLRSRSYARWNPLGLGTVYYGPTASTALVMNWVLTEWKQKASDLEPLSWAIAEPMWMEAGLRRAAELLMADSDRRFREIEVFVNHWARTQEALAVADAWLWLESGEPERVARWLERFVSYRDAWSLVPYLKCNPGRALVSLENYERWKSTTDDSWVGWTWGPIAPDAIRAGRDAPRIPG